MPSGVYPRVKGYKRPLWVCQKISKGLTGKKLTDEHRKSLSIGQKKREPFSEEQRENMRKAHLNGPKGANHWSWKGGRTPELMRIRNSSAYRQFRKKVLERDGYSCTECGAKEEKLYVDHIKAFSLFPELRMEVSNGRTLCLGCHKKTKSFARNKPLAFCPQCPHCQT